MIYKLLIIITLLCTLSCNSTKNLNKNNFNQPNISIIGCPEGTKCKVNILSNKKLKLSFSEIEKIKPELVNGGNFVVEVEIDKISSKELSDDFYKESIKFELPNLEEKKYSDSDFEQLNMIHGIWCFCKGINGYYKVKEGSVELEKVKGGLELDIMSQLEDVKMKYENIKLFIEKK